MNDLEIAIDWKSNWCHRKDIIKSHESYAKLVSKKKKDI